MPIKLISVIIPVYNTEVYLEECLESVINQTIGIEKIKLIIIDDASTDNSLEYLLKYEQRYPDHILLIKLEEKKGQADARNIGLEYVDTPYFVFLDSDDWMAPDSYEKMITEAEKNQCDLLQCSWVEYLNGNIYYAENDRTTGYYKIESTNDRKDFIKKGIIKGMAGNSLYRTEWAKKFEFKKFAKYEDNYWGGIIAFYINSYCAISNPYFHYRRHEGSNSLSRNDEMHFEHLRVELELLKYYHEADLWNEYYEVIRERFLKIFYSGTLHIICCQFDYFPLERVKEMQDIVKEIFPDYLEWCKNSELFINSVITVAFDFPLTIWEEYKKLYLDWVEKGAEEGLANFYVGMRKVLGM